MPECCLDTSIIIAIERHKLAVASLASFGAFSLPSIVVSELWLGAHLGTDMHKVIQRRAFIEEFVVRCQVLPFDEETAKIHARMHADLRKRSYTIGANDMLIAATALHYQLPLLTLNAEEFRRIPELDVINPQAVS